MPHPATLRELVEEYEMLIARQAASGSAKPDQRTQDLAYTLCVSTGTRDVRQALERARRQLAVARGPVTPMPLRAAGPGVAEARGPGEAVAQ
ncbi:DUF5133 domain-containing protein [Streptomyces sp. NPDC048484]|uniref:DUF5133 domain-containing protein n=1 Tax=Streptomyces sp. NPDC048484 TaxID=3155146 RepID=UPI0034279770